MSGEAFLTIVILRLINFYFISFSLHLALANSCTITNAAHVISFGDLDYYRGAFLPILILRLIKRRVKFDHQVVSSTSKQKKEKLF